MNYTDFQTYITRKPMSGRCPKSYGILEYLERIKEWSRWYVSTCETRESKQYYRKSEKIFQNFQAGYKGNIKLKLYARYRLDSSLKKIDAKLLTISNEELLVDVHLRNNSKHGKCWILLWLPDTSCLNRNHLLGTEVRKLKGCRLMMVYSSFGYMAMKPWIIVEC